MTGRHWHDDDLSHAAEVDTDPPPPPRVTYQRTPARTDQRRSFRVTIGLHPGYPAGRSPVGYATVSDPAGRVVEAHQRWMAGRIDAGLPYLTGVFTEGWTSYAWPRPETEPDQPPGGAVEHTLVFAGEVSVLYAANVTDEQAEAMLDDLAGVLGQVAGQQRVYVAYRDRTWCLDRHEVVVEATNPPV